MVVNVIVRKGAIALISESLAREILEENKTVNVDVKPGGFALVIEDGASPAEVRALIDTVESG